MKSSPLSILLASTSLLSLPVLAETLEFDFKDPKGVNNAQFHLDAPLEIISGFANGISGTVAFDPTNPESTVGTIVIDATSLSVGNPMMQEHLHGENWMNTAQFPKISFKIDSLEIDSGENNQMEGTATGTMTMHGVSKEMSVPVRLNYLPGRLGARLNDESIKGDLLVVRSQFSFPRADFEIRPGVATDKVGEMIDITLSIVGAHTH